jgi:hypothetical protein
LWHEVVGGSFNKTQLLGICIVDLPPDFTNKHPLNSCTFDSAIAWQSTLSLPLFKLPPQPMQILTEDYSKCAFLTADRSVAFHTRMGKHFTTRVPKAGRDLAYLPSLAELVVAGSSSDLWRINLYEGRFMTPLATSAAAVNALGVSPAHGLLAAAGQGGVLECFDPRIMATLGAANTAAAMGFSGEDMTAVRFDSSGLYIAAGTSGVAPAWAAQIGVPSCHLLALMMAKCAA